MPDESNNLNQTQSGTTPVTSAPSLSDPQKLVDEALTSPQSAAAPTPTLTTPIAETVAPTIDEKAEPAVPTELLNTQAEEVPLAFANSIPADMPAAGVNPLTAASPIGGVPPFTPPTTSTSSMTPPPMPEKKKSKMGKLVAGLMGFFLLAGGIFGGYYYYTNYLGETPVVAELNIACYNECRNVKGKGEQVCQCSCGGPCTRPDSPGASSAPADAIVSCSLPAGQRFQCGKTPDGSCGGFCINGISKTCDDWLRQECNFEPERGGEFKVVEAGDTCPVGYQSTSCTCGLTNGYKMCFDRGLESQCGIPTDGNGLCAVWTQAGAPTTPAEQDGTITPSTTYYCPGQFLGEDNNSCMTAAPAHFNINCYCGTIQVDTPGMGFHSETMRCGCNEEETPNPSVTPSPSPSAAPVLSCTGLTKDKADADIKIGTIVQFTCTGAVTPAGATNLTYNYRISKDDGAWQSLTTTAGKASYTVTAAGSYTTECRACGTINNASVCDPTWTGATAQ